MTDKLITVAEHIQNHAQEPLNLKHLADLVGWSAGYLQKQFKQRFGISPKEYHNMQRLQSLKQNLQTSDNTLDAIYAAGYGSPSRVYGEPSRQLGMSPSSYSRQGQGEHISYAFGDTPFGLLAMAATDKGVCFVQFGDSEATLIEQLKHEFQQAHISPSDQQNSPLLDDWVAALCDYLYHHGPKPDLPLDMRGTAFQIQVWKYLLSLKQSNTVSYAELAKAIGKPTAHRAVANACGKNNIGVLIPCHQVLRSDGSLGGYRWGTERKQALLDSHL